VNDGPSGAAAAVFTGNRVKAAPVVWSQQVMAGGRLKAVVLNAGGANACTGPDGFADTHRTAERVAQGLAIGAGEVGVASTGLIGRRLPMDRLIPGVDAAIAALDSGTGTSAAEAIRTTDSVAKQAAVHGDGWTIGGMAKGAGMLAPGLATMLCVLTTDAALAPAMLQRSLTAAVDRTLNRLDSDGCMSTNDTVFLLASGASGTSPAEDAFTSALTAICADLSAQLLADAEGATKEVRIDVTGAASEADAVEVGRSIARNNLLKCALFGNDPNWGRVLAAIGTTRAAFDPDCLDVALNGVQVCRAGAPGASEDAVDLAPRAVLIAVDLHAGQERASIFTNDLSHAYVHENSAYSS
jgi:glutamate N-acetyltransferase/amino-acid N-acetyltransferase